MRALLLALALGAPCSAQDRCIVACDATSTGPEAADRLALHLDHPLPGGVAVVGLVEGGFQDAFIQARLEVPAANLGRLLRDLALDPAGLAPRADEDFGPPGPAWWDPENEDGLVVGHGNLDAFASTLMGVVPGETATTVYLWAFQT